MRQLHALIPLLAALGAAPAAAQAPPPLVVDTLAPGLYRIAGPPDGSVLVWRAAEGPVVVDGLSPARAAALDSLVRALAGGPPRVLVNTHYHEDHRGLNARANAAGARTLAHPRAIREMRRDTTITELDWRRTAAPAAALPREAVADSVVLGAGAERMVVFAVAPAHTGGDLMAWLPGPDVLHTGDVVEMGAFPFVDRWAGGGIDGLIAGVGMVLERAGPATRIVPGHGPVVNRTRVRAYRDMLVMLRERVIRTMAGEDVDAVLADPRVAGLVPEWGSANQLRYFVTALHAELIRR
ncbi:MAG: MBL fold metallo-hydrolase [Gemmatimonadota bacterium]